MASEASAPIGRTVPFATSGEPTPPPWRERDYLGGGLREIELDAISPSALCGIQGDVSALNQPV